MDKTTKILLDYTSGKTPWKRPITRWRTPAPISG